MRTTHFARRAVVAFLVVAARGTAAQKEAPPPLGAPKDFRLPAKRELTLPNGMRVTLVPFGTVPRATIMLTVRSGRIDELPSEVSLSQLTGDLMEEGTKRRDAAQVANAIAGMGGELAVTVESDRTRIGGAVLSDHAAEMVKLVGEVARSPRLPESELARIKDNRRRDLAIQLSQPQPIAEQKFREVLFPGHAYGRLFPSDSMLAGFTIEQVRAFYAKNFGAKRAHLYVVGVFDAAPVEQAVRAAFGDWAAGPAPATDLPAMHKTRSLALIDRPGAVQSTILMGLPVADPTSKDFTALEVTDALLGGTFGSRITTNIREQKGYTYSPFSQISTRYHTAYWAEEADVTTNVTGASLKEIFGEIDRLRKEAPPPIELAGVKNNMVGLFTLRNGSREGIIGQLDFVNRQGLPESYLTEYVKRVMAVSPDEVRKSAQTYLAPERMTIVVVGDRKTVEEQVAPYAAATP